MYINGTLKLEVKIRNCFKLKVLYIRSRIHEFDNFELNKTFVFFFKKKLKNEFLVSIFRFAVVSLKIGVGTI